MDCYQAWNDVNSFWAFFVASNKQPKTPPGSGRRCGSSCWYQWLIAGRVIHMAGMFGQLKTTPRKQQTMRTCGLWSFIQKYLWTIIPHFYRYILGHYSSAISFTLWSLRGWSADKHCSNFSAADFLFVKDQLHVKPKQSANFVVMVVRTFSEARKVVDGTFVSLNLTDPT